MTGVLQSTLGNLPELFVVFFALRAGELVVAQTSILGSLFANALLVLGAVIIVGAAASPDRVMRFDPRLPKDTSTLLLMAVFIIALLGLAVGTGDRAARHEVAHLRVRCCGPDRRLRAPGCSATSATTGTRSARVAADERAPA